MDAATIEETNRIRVSLGMKPLPVPGAPSGPQARGSNASADSSEEEGPSTVETRQAQAYDNYNKAMDAKAAKKQREEKTTAIKKARDKVQRFALLEGKGLGEDDGDSHVGARSWLLGQKKRQKRIDKTRKLEEELAATEATAAAAVEYTSKDLAGIKVAHDSSAFLDGDNQILTLKDATIGQNEEDGDELENLDMREQERLNDNLDLKKKRPGYNPNDDDSKNEGVLAQYDEDIYGKKSKNFTLDSRGAIAELSDILDQPAQRQTANQSVNLDAVIGERNASISNDYLEASEIKVKKTKKKKSKGTRKKQDDEDDIFPLDSAALDDGMDVDEEKQDVTRGIKRRVVEDDVFVDDEDLQASLALQRRSALKKRKRVKPADLAKQLKEESDTNDTPTTDDYPGSGLVIGEISEFVAGLGKGEEDESRTQRRPRTTTKSPENEEDQLMDDADMGDYVANIKKESDNEEVGVDEEKVVGEGMGAALALLRERGLVQDAHGDEKYRNFRNREGFLTQKRLLEEELDEEARNQRERDRNSGRMDRMSVRDREEYARQQNTWRDHQQSRRVAELYSSGYKPNVELKYTDEHGRSLDQKEAFKHLSHQFHGKTSGKGKTEKRLKKIGDEQRREAQSLFDASQAGMSLAAQQQVKKRKEAGVRLG